MTDYNKIEALDILKLDFGSHTPIDLRVAELLINHFGGHGSTRVYATFKDGVYKGQIASAKSIDQLQELITAYNVDLTACTTDTSDLINRAQVVHIN